MSDVTIKQLAKVLGMSADRLLAQLGEAGMRFSDPGDVVSDAEKQSLLSFLRNNHGKQDKAEAKVGSPDRITLRRRKVSELRVSSGTGRGSSSKTVNVEVRAKRTYVRRADATNDADLAEEREEARRRLRESHEQREREQVELDAQKQRREEVARLAAEKKSAGAAGAQSEADEAVPAVDAATVTAELDAPRTDTDVPAPVEAVQADAEPTPAAATETTVAGETDPQAAAPSSPPSTEGNDDAGDGSAQKNAWDVPVMPHIYARRKHHKKPEAEAAASAPKEPAQADASARKRTERHAPAREAEGQDDDKHGKKRARGGKLHLSEQDRARRGSSRRRGHTGTAQTVAASGSHGFSRPTAPVVREVAIADVNQVTDLAQKMAVKGAEVVKALFKMGVMATINQTVDHDTAALVVEELGHKPVDAAERTAETTLLEQAATVEEEGKKEPRPPVVTIMGHVDHGKTSLLDHIRRTKVAAGEVGGITQHIGAYHVTTDKGVITFLDTPGHAAFTAMRARGAKSTDIVVLVVAADDGVKPQTIEAIDHARAAHVPLIVAINKIDKDGANIDNVKQALASHEVVPEDWGGDVQCVPLSAKTGQGVDNLLSAISLQAELMELKAVVDGPASGTVIESRLDRGRGPVATMLVQHGTLKKGDFVVCGVEYGRMRALVGADGKRQDSAGPSIPVQVLGLSGVPAAGDDFVCVADEKLAKQVAEERLERRRESRMMTKANRLEDIMARMGQGETQQVLNILVKADVQGSAEALREALSQIGNDMVKVNVIASGVGGITESDATLAVASKALLIGFNVRADASARKVVETSGVDMRYFSIIYDVIDQVTQAASGLLGNEVREDIIGTAEVRDVFRSSRFGAVAGCIVSEGVVRHNKPIRVLREHTVVFEGELESLRRFKDNVEEVHAGTECGIAVKKYNDVQPGDQIECFERVEVARTL